MSQRRRFYKSVAVTADLSIALDGRAVKTPLKSALSLPTRALADAVAAEWEAQGEKIRPSTMVFTRLANTAIDRVGPGRARIAAEVLDYANSDLVCYRADSPLGLIELQAALWDPVVDWAFTALDAPFAVTIGIVHVAQPEAAIRAFAAALAALNDFELSAFYTIMTMAGSALLAMMLARGGIDPDTAWAAAHADEDYQIEHWGQDYEAADRRAARKQEFMACCRFMEMCRGGSV